MKSISFLCLLFLFPLISSAQTFSINERGCVTCNDAKPGDMGVIDGVTYTAVDRAMLLAKIKADEDLTKVCVSLVTDMSSLFNDFWSGFNQSLSNWDVSNVTNMKEMFSYSRYFNQPIGNWDVSKVTNMRGMFESAYSFNQDLSNWCVNWFATEPNEFAGNSGLVESNKPKWGTCPENPIPFDYIIISPINVSEAIPQTFKFAWTTIETATQYQVVITDQYNPRSVYLDTLLTVKEIKPSYPLVDFFYFI